MWNLPRPGLEPVSPALAGRFSTTAPPGKPHLLSTYHEPGIVPRALYILSHLGLTTNYEGSTSSILILQMGNCVPERLSNLLKVTL